MNLKIQEKSTKKKYKKKIFTKCGAFIVICLFVVCFAIFADSNPDANDDENDNIRECSIERTKCSGDFTDVVHEVDAKGGSYTTVFGIAGESKCKTNGHSGCGNMQHSPKAEPASISLQYVGTFPVIVSCDSCDFTGNYNVIVKPKACVITINLPEKLPGDGEVFPIEKTFSTTATFNCTTCGIEEKEGVTCSKDELGGGVAHYEEKNLTWTATCGNGTKQEKKDFDFWVYELIDIDIDADFYGTDNNIKYHVSEFNFNNKLKIHAKINPTDVPNDKIEITWKNIDTIYEENKLLVTILVDKVSYNGINISASIGDKEKKAKLFIFNIQKATPTHTFNLIKVDNLITDDISAGRVIFGMINTPQADVVVNILDNFYYNNEAIGYNYSKILSDVKWQTKANGRVNFNETTPYPVGLGMKEDSTQEEIIKMAIDDLSSRTAGNGHPYCHSYWSEAATTAHEIFHFEHWKIIYEPELNDMFKMIEDSLTLEYLKNQNDIYEVLDECKSEVEFEAYNFSLEEFLLDAETEAHAISNRMYQEIVDKIKKIGNTNEKNM